MVENTRICQVCCDPPQVAGDASEVTRNNQDLTTYIYASTIQSELPAWKPRYQFKSQTERIQALIGQVSNPQAIAFRRNGGQCGQR